MPENKSLYLGMLIILLTGNGRQHLQAQNPAVYAQHEHFEQFVNPAITGRDRYPMVAASHKRNWIGTPDAPVTTCAGGSFRLGQFDFYTPTKMLNKTNLVSRDRMGAGGFLMREQNGPLSQLFMVITYAYFLPLNANRTTELSFGLSGQLHHFGVDEDMLDPMDPEDPELTGLDQLPLMADAGFGVYFHTEQFHAGGSINELFHTDSPLEDKRLVSNAADFFFQTGYKFYLKRFDLEPSIFLARVDADPWYSCARIRIYYQHYNWLAMAFTSARTLTLSAGFRIGRLHLAYGYEQNLSSLAHYFTGSHELVLGLNIGLFEPEGLRKRSGKKP